MRIGAALRITPCSHSAPRRASRLRCSATRSSRETLRFAPFIRSPGRARILEYKKRARRGGTRANCSLRSQLRLHKYVMRNFCANFLGRTRAIRGARERKTCAFLNVHFVSLGFTLRKERELRKRSLRLSVRKGLHRRNSSRVSPLGPAGQFASLFANDFRVGRWGFEGNFANGVGLGLHASPR